MENGENKYVKLWKLEKNVKRYKNKNNNKEYKDVEAQGAA